jgi:HEAT repeat protein
MPGLSTTFDLLGRTENEAAIAVLVAGLDAVQREVRDLALTALLNRRSATAELHLLRRWNELPHRWQSQIADRLGWLSGAIRTALVNRQAPFFASACAAAIFTRDYDAIPRLAAAASDENATLADQAAAVTLELAELLADELAAPRDYRIRRDPQVQRQHVVASLEAAVTDIKRPPRCELFESLLLLAERDNSVLKRVLQSPSDRAFPLVSDILAQSTRPGIERLLLSYLDDPFAPLSALQLIGRRGDVSFVRQLTRKIGPEPAATIRANLRRIEAIPWIAGKLSVLDALREAEQPGAVHLAVCASIPREHAGALTVYLCNHGKLAARRIAARALAEFLTPETDVLTVELLRDDVPVVRAAAAGQLRARNIPGAIQRLMGLLDSPHPEEREAAQSCLAEFRFDRFAAQFDQLAPDVRKTTGMVVRRVDPRAVERVAGELAAESRSRRLRGLELAVALNVAQELEGEIAALVKDDDQYVRIEAIHTLAMLATPLAQETLRDALLDSQPLVQQAAEAELENLVRRSASLPKAAAAATSILAAAPLAEVS